MKRKDIFHLILTLLIQIHTQLVTVFPNFINSNNSVAILADKNANLISRRKRSTIDFACDTANQRPDNGSTQKPS